MNQRLTPRVGVRGDLLRHRLFEQAGALLKPPFVDDLDVEAPVAADFEPRQLTLLQKAINGGAMDAEIIRNSLTVNTLGAAAIFDGSFRYSYPMS